MSAARATIVLVCRDRWLPAPRALRALLSGTDPRHSIVVVAAGAPARVRRELDRIAARTDRVRLLVGPRFLPGNAARNLGADGARTEWLAFVETDAELAPGGLDRLVAVGEERDAASVYPVYLEDGDDGLRVHGAGADLEVGGPPGAQWLKEHLPYCGRRWDEVAGEIVAAARPQAEPHALVIRRAFVESLGGFDEDLLSWFDHVDLGLHHRHLGAPAWLVPSVTCRYRPAPPLGLADAGTFALRWSGDWYRRSLERLCATWGLAPDDPGWAAHDRYRRAVRARVPTRWDRLNRLLDRVGDPLDDWWAQRWRAAAGAS